jgi:hypothetical protein
VLKGAGDENEKFKLDGRAPGECRIVVLALGMEEKLSETGLLQRLLMSEKDRCTGCGRAGHSAVREGSLVLRIQVPLPYLFTHPGFT